MPFLQANGEKSINKNVHILSAGMMHDPALFVYVVFDTALTHTPNPLMCLSLEAIQRSATCNNWGVHYAQAILLIDNILMAVKSMRLYHQHTC